MGFLKKEVFVCLDCETTGLDTENDRIIEVAVASFDFDTIFESFESLVDPEYAISESSQEIHKITKEMLQGKPKIKDILSKVFKIMGHHIVVGHGINFDLSLLKNAAKREVLPYPLSGAVFIDTLRLARLYGESRENSLEKLRQHFNIAPEGAHRAMSDVLVNISVFKYLAKNYKTTEELLQRLEKPILLKAMPLGKHKGRKFDEIPLEYLLWAANKDFDQDLLYSLRKEINNRKKGNRFEQASNPFSCL